MASVIALVGRPNVGKSTLFNRLTRTRDALVADLPGLTRDRKYGTAHFEDESFIVIDTGGISGDEDGIDARMAQQSLMAIDEADVVFFLCDSRDGLVPADHLIADHLRKNDKKVFLLANKIDGLDSDYVLAEFYSLGFDKVYPITATHGRGVLALLSDTREYLGEELEKQPQQLSAKGIRIGVVGRPNVGKSTLVNRLLGEERVVVYDYPGTTRDSIYIPYQRHNKDYTLIDTAGVRRRNKTKGTAEKFSVVKTLQAIRDAHVVVMVIDAHEGLVDQDLHLLGFILESGRALVIALNKWDGMGVDEKKQINQAMDRKLAFIDFAKVHAISALHGTGVGNLYDSIDKAYHSASRKLPTKQLNQILAMAVEDHEPPSINKRRIKLRYAHSGGNNPPIIVIHGNQTEKLPGSYCRYLEKTFRKAMKLEGTPIRIELRNSENPYTQDVESLSDREKARKRRLKQSREYNKKRR